MFSSAKRRGQRVKQLKGGEGEKQRKLTPVVVRHLTYLTLPYAEGSPPPHWRPPTPGTFPRIQQVSQGNFSQMIIFGFGKAVRALSPSFKVFSGSRSSFPAKPILSTFCRPSSTTQKPGDLEVLLGKPSWSVKSLFDSEDPSEPTPTISQKQLHHLLRLSALPLPTSEAQEARMIKDLQSQLKFVRAIQRVDTEGVEPLQSIRDETKEAGLENEITLASLQADLDKEEVVGKRGRIRRRGSVSSAPSAEGTEDWDPLSQAPNTLGRFFVVDTAKD